MNRLLMLFMLCLALVACQSTVNTVENKNKNMRTQSLETSKVSTDDFLKGRLRIISIDKADLAGGLMKVQVTAKSMRASWLAQLGSWFMGDNPYHITYRFNWLDKDGMEVSNGTQSWIPMTVVPGDTIRLVAVSPSPRCKDFVLSLRENLDARD